MADYHRYFVAGGTYFFTVVTQNRLPLLTRRMARGALGRVMRDCFARYPVRVIAMVLLPDHLHTLWSLPAGDDRYSLRWRWVKREFTREWLASGGQEAATGRLRGGERRRFVWQRRFWEHLVRDEADLEAHFDYIHYNPVKHGYVTRPRDWEWSTFHRWVRSGHYDIDWAAKAGIPLPGDAGE